MDNSFEISINFRSKDSKFNAEYISTGYSYRINVDMFGQVVSFEPNEERNFRALLSNDDLHEVDKTDKFLIEQIAHQLILVFKD